MSLRVRGIDFYFHSRRRFPARSKFQVFPAAGANDRTTFCHTVSDGVGETYFLEEGFYFSIERSAADDDFIKITMLLSPEEANRVSEAFNRDFDGNLVDVPSGFGAIDFIQKGVHT